MSTVERLESMQGHVNRDKTWGSYDKKGDSAVNRAMMPVLRKMLDAAREEEQQRAHFSLAKRVAAVEKGVAAFHKAIRSNPDSGLEDSDPRDVVFHFLKQALIASGVEEELARHIMRVMPVDSF